MSGCLLEIQILPTLQNYGDLKSSEIAIPQEKSWTTERRNFCETSEINIWEEYILLKFQ